MAPGVPGIPVKLDSPRELNHKPSKEGLVKFSKPRRYNDIEKFDQFERFDKIDNSPEKSEKVEFLREFSNKYGYNGKIDTIIDHEYPHLKNTTYLDHTGATIYPKSAVDSFADDLRNHCFGNPHSKNSSSQLSTERVNRVRARVLNYFNADPNDYQVIFTQNATAAIKMVGEVFPWTYGKSSFRYMRENHNSIVGLRRFAEENNSPDVKVVTEKDLESMFNAYSEHRNVNLPPETNNSTVYGLFAYPAQCNFSGRKFPLSWVKKIKSFDTDYSKILILLDAAAYVSCSPLSLADKDDSPDFVALSFYKMFGFPTGLGALIVKNELSSILKKRYFGGGTLRAVAFDRSWQMFRRDLSERFEDGTINFLNIIALEHSFNAMEKIYGNLFYVREHLTSLSTFLYRKLSSLRHLNGSPLCVLYSNNDYSDSSLQGPIFNFNVKRADGSWIGYREVEAAANERGINLRVGAFCNPGGLAKWLKFTPDQVMAGFLEGKVCDDDIDIFKGRIVGSVRVSLGAMTTIDDVLKLLAFLREYIDNTTSAPPLQHKSSRVMSKHLSQKVEMSITHPNMMVEKMTYTRDLHPKQLE
ncbi:PLP-dependent transferase [Gigaspora margarita]|uniref:PLP-dependent transferase n=1 Tax=Gigaspora margarita TaxID=4874 RepID=A0A8H4AX87_GIGMA|nr:PLP-dependent transferase [Gigaspora margarita]